MGGKNITSQTRILSYEAFPSSRKRDSQLVFPMPAIGNSANNDFVTHRGQIQVVIMDWNCRLNFVGLTWPHLLWRSIEQELQRSLRWFLASVFVQVQNGKHFWQFPLFLSISHLTVSYINFCIAKLTKSRLTANRKFLRNEVLWLQSILFNLFNVILSTFN